MGISELLPLGWSNGLTGMSSAFNEPLLSSGIARWEEEEMRLEVESGVPGFKLAPSNVTGLIRLEEDTGVEGLTGVTMGVGEGPLAAELRITRDEESLEVAGIGVFEILARMRVSGTR